MVGATGCAYRRELNTMPQWAGSCWYYLRFCDPHNEPAPVGAEAERYWMGERGVDLYVGGVEHAVLHLLYARFWHKVLYDLGHVSTPEPFGRLFNQGYILADAFQDERGVYVPAAEVEERDGQFSYQGRPVTRSFGKMGKSLKNSVSPDEIFAEYGVDTLRLYEMFMGPLDASKPWTTRDIVGVHRFVLRLWRTLVDPETGELLVSEAEADPELLALTHRTIAAVTADMEGAPLQHGGRPLLRVEQRPGGPGAGAPRGGRGLRALARPLRPPPLRGALGAPGARRVGGLRPLARVRPGPGRRGHGDHGGPGERQGARPHRRPRRDRRGGGPGAGPGLREGGPLPAGRGAGCEWWPGRPAWSTSWCRDGRRATGGSTGRGPGAGG